MQHIALVLLLALAAEPQPSAQAASGNDPEVLLQSQAATATIAQPQRDRQSPQTASSRIRGRVVRADTGAPIRGALIRLSTADVRDAGSVMTDGGGRYEIVDLPPGRYNVSATRDGFVQLSYGQLRPLQGGKPLQLKVGEVLERIDFALPRGAVISGRVLDELGEPVANSNVQALQLRFVNGRRTPLNVGLVSITWDNGEFRLWGLSPGEYLVSASPSGMAGSMVSRSDRVGYAPSYYPNTTNPAEAQRIIVGLGQTLTNITIGLVATRTASVAGIAVDAAGNAAHGGQVTLAPRDSTGLLMLSNGMIRPDGGFVISNVPPGDYVIRANLPPAWPGGPLQFAETTVTVNGDDVNDVRLTPRVPVYVRGRLTVDGGAQSSRAIPFVVAARPRTPEGSIGGGVAGSPGIVKEDHSFELSAFPGPALIQVGITGPAASPWSIRAITRSASDSSASVRITRNSSPP